MSTIYASFIDPTASEHAVGALLDHGAAPAQISVLVPEGSSYARSIRTESEAAEGISITTPTDVGVGAIKGGVAGAGIGALAAIASLFIPGVGFVLGGGALGLALAGGAASFVAGIAAGSVVGLLTDQGVPETLAAKYSNDLELGGAILAINVSAGDLTASEAESILVKYGALNMCTLNPEASENMPSAPTVRDNSGMTFQQPVTLVEGSVAPDVWSDPDTEAAVLEQRTHVEDDLEETTNVPATPDGIPMTKTTAIEEDLKLRHPLPGAYADNPKVDPLE